MRVSAEETGKSGAAGTIAVLAVAARTIHANAGYAVASRFRAGRETRARSQDKGEAEKLKGLLYHMSVLKDFPKT